MQILKQSTEIKVRIGPAVDATDGVTPETTLDISTADQAELLKHDGAATVDISANTFAAITGCDGWYDLTLTATDTGTLGMLTAVIQDSSLCLPIFIDFMVVTANVYDSLCDTDTLQADLTQIGGVAQSATDLKDFSDSGYDPSTHKVQGVVLCDTTTTNTDMRGTDGANTTTPPTVTEIRTEMDTNSTKMAPSQTLDDYKATGFSVPNEYDTVIAALQTDLDNPDQYKADVSALALEASLNDIKGTGFVKDTHSLPQCITATGFSVPNEYDAAIAALATAAALTTHDGKLDTVDTVVDAIKAKTDNLPSGLAKNVAVPKFDVFMVLSSDHVTGATGKTVTGTISKDGGAFVALTNPITEVGNGVYTIVSGLTQDERNADVSTLKFSADGCDDRIITIISS